MQDLLKHPTKEETGSRAAFQNVNWILVGRLKFMEGPSFMKNKLDLICLIFEKEWVALYKNLSKHLENSYEVATEGTNHEDPHVVGDIECWCCYCEYPFEEMDELHATVPSLQMEIQIAIPTFDISYYTISTNRNSQ